MCQMTLQLYHIICVKWHYNYTTLYVSNDITIKYSFRLHCQSSRYTIKYSFRLHCQSSRYTIKYSFRLHCQSSRYFEMHEVFTPYILKWRVQFVFCYFVVLLSIEMFVIILYSTYLCLTGISTQGVCDISWEYYRPFLSINMIWTVMCLFYLHINHEYNNIFVLQVSISSISLKHIFYWSFFFFSLFLLKNS